MPDTKSKLAGVAMIASSAFGGIIIGYDAGLIGGIIGMKDWLRTLGHPEPNSPVGYALSSSTESLVVSILSLGTFCGALLGSPVGDFFGRRWGVIISCLIVCAGAATEAASTSVTVFTIGRVFGGLGVGLSDVLVPIYLAECAPKWCRGTIVCFYVWFMTVGILIATNVNNVSQLRDDHSAYRIPISLQIVWGIFLIVGMSLLPESPRWFVRQGRYQEAKESFAKINGLAPTDPEVESQLEEVRTDLEAEKALGRSSYIDCFKASENKIAFRTISGILLLIFMQLNGIIFVIYYGTTFFIKSGFKDPFLISVIIGMVNSVAVLLLSTVGIERFGRRPPLLLGYAGSCVCHYLIGILDVTVSARNSAYQHLLVVLVCIYIVFAGTSGAVSCVVVGEIFPLQIRAKAISLCWACYWVFNFCVTYATPYLVNDQPGSAGLGPKVFFLWGTTCFCGLIFNYFCIPETKGLSLEQIDQMYQRVSPINSHKFREQLAAEGKAGDSCSSLSSSENPEEKV